MVKKLFVNVCFLENFVRIHLCVLLKRDLLALIQIDFYRTHLHVFVVYCTLLLAMLDEVWKYSYLWDVD